SANCDLSARVFRRKVAECFCRCRIADPPPRFFERGLLLSRYFGGGRFRRVELTIDRSNLTHQIRAEACELDSDEVAECTYARGASQIFVHDQIDSRSDLSIARPSSSTRPVRSP